MPPVYDGVQELKFVRPVTPGSVQPVRNPSHSATISYTMPQRKLDPNRYATKKTIAQGMLDVALLTANASQLRYVLQAGESHEFYTLMVTLISISIGLQIIVGIALMILGALDINEESPTQRAADIVNDITIILVFIITLLNVVIAAFGIENTRTVFVEATPATKSAALRFEIIK